MVSNPSMRGAMLRYLDELQDSEYQYRTFSKNPLVPRFVDDAVDFLFDMSGLGDGYEEVIGALVRDRAELALVHELAKLLDAITERYPDLPDREIIRTNDWLFVRHAAELAFEECIKVKD